MDDDCSSRKVAENGDNFQGKTRRKMWILGLLLLIVGGARLLQRFTNLDVENWWGFLLVVPAAGFFSTARNRFRERNFVPSREIARLLILGLLFISLSAVFGFNLDRRLILPILLFLFGMFVALSVILRREP